MLYVGHNFLWQFKSSFCQLKMQLNKLIFFFLRARAMIDCGGRAGAAQARGGILTARCPSHGDLMTKRGQCARRAAVRNSKPG